MTSSSLLDQHANQESTTVSENGDIQSSNANRQVSALQDNIEKKGSNAYYFAHAHKSTGPKWDGKAEPKRLSAEELGENGIHQPSQGSVRKVASFDYSKSNITTYAFLDDGMKVKVYVTMEGVGDKCTNEEDISLKFTTTTLSLEVKNYRPGDSQMLCFAKLSGEITSAAYKLKKDRIILTLTKAKEGVWTTINDKGTSDHDDVV